MPKEHSRFHLIDTLVLPFQINVVSSEGDHAFEYR